MDYVYIGIRAYVENELKSHEYPCFENDEKFFDKVVDKVTDDVYDELAKVFEAEEGEKSTYDKLVEKAIDELA